MCSSKKILPLYFKWKINPVKLAGLYRGLSPLKGLYWFCASNMLYFEKISLNSISLIRIYSEPWFRLKIVNKCVQVKKYYPIISNGKLIPRILGHLIPEQTFSTIYLINTILRTVFYQINCSGCFFLYTTKYNLYFI